MMHCQSHGQLLFIVQGRCDSATQVLYKVGESLQNSSHLLVWLPQKAALCINTTGEGRKEKEKHHIGEACTWNVRCSTASSKHSVYEACVPPNLLLSLITLPHLLWVAVVPFCQGSTVCSIRKQLFSVKTLSAIWKCFPYLPLAFLA